jgi:hypothetical protein
MDLVAIEAYVHVSRYVREHSLHFFVVVVLPMAESADIDFCLE